MVGYLDSDGVYKWGVVKEDVSEGYSYSDGKVKIEHILKIIKVKIVQMIIIMM